MSYLVLSRSSQGWDHQMYGSKNDVHKFARMTREFSALEEMLVRGTEDVVSEEEVWGIVAEFVGSRDEEAVRAMAVGLIAEVVQRGWMTPETLGVPWTMAPWDAIRFLSEEWAVRATRGDSPIHLCWLVSTRKGKERGIRLGETDGWTFRWKGVPFESRGSFIRTDGGLSA
jgi:hypothetical protein